ncbi:hypothetical protein B0H15DRAFT_955845 [Mycena belliarum]|uniref:Uncharacterized protein n=1 Tax=Mycena belliarum TaxID=1033014 RepID=A0AAD6XFT6_9AGAR|nr:hypothetical protein B0H15DRAFT_955845 [Mycena belliae]
MGYSGPQRLVPVGAAVSHALGALTAVVGIGDGGDVSEPLATGGALESGFVAGGARDWRRTVYDCFSTLDLTHSVSAQLGGATCARGVGSNAVIFGACRLLGLFLGGATCARGVGSNTVIFGTCRLLGLFFGPTRCWRSSAALPALGLWDLTPGPSAHVGCSGSSESTSRVAGLCGSERIRSSALLHRSRSERLLDASERGRMFHRRHISHALASPGPIARSLLPESPVSFRSTADSPIHEISNEIMAPMTMFQPHFKSGVRLWLAGALLSRSTLINLRYEVRIGRESTSESQHRRLTSLASTDLRRSNLRPPLALFDFNSVTDDVVNPDSSSEPRIRIPRSVSPAPRTQPGLMLAPFQIAQIGRRGDTPNSICAGRRDQAAHRARKARATSPTPALATSHRSRPRPSSLVSSAGSSSEYAAKAACEHEHVSRPCPRPPYVPSQQASRHASTNERTAGHASRRSGPRPSSRFESEALSSEAKAACEHERTSGLGPCLGTLRRPTSPDLAPADCLASQQACPSGRGPPLIRVEVEPRCRASQQKPEIGTRPDPRRLACEHRTRSVPPTPSHRTAADIGPPSSQFEPGVGCKGEHRASSVPPTPSHRTAADIGPPSSQFEPGVGCKGEHRASSVPPTPSHRASLVSSAESSSESAAKASTSEQRPAHALRTYVAPLRRPCPPYVEPR